MPAITINNVPRDISPGADLHGADLRGAYLRGANMNRADLHGANMNRADLSGANMNRADLRYADLRYADLRGADLRYADLGGAYLREADLRGAYLRGADLRYADLGGAYLRGADLREADLRGAYLRGADLPEGLREQLSIIPAGDVTGWKKCRDGVVVRLMIPAGARRSNSTSRKCRAEYADVLEVTGTEAGISQYDHHFTYRAGERVQAPVFDPDWTRECGGGIHFFLTRQEAENY